MVFVPAMLVMPGVRPLEHPLPDSHGMIGMMIGKRLERGKKVGKKQGLG